MGKKGDAPVYWPLAISCLPLSNTLHRALTAPLQVVQGKWHRVSSNLGMAGKASWWVSLDLGAEAAAAS